MCTRVRGLSRPGGRCTLVRSCLVRVIVWPMREHVQQRARDERLEEVDACSRKGRSERVVPDRPPEPSPRGNEGQAEGGHAETVVGGEERPHGEAHRQPV